MMLNTTSLPTLGFLRRQAQSHLAEKDGRYCQVSPGERQAYYKWISHSNSSQRLVSENRMPYCLIIYVGKIQLPDRLDTVFSPCMQI